MALAGISLEEYIAAKVGVPGYGVLLGATIGNALSDGVAALPQGYKAASGVTLGALIPVIPLGVADAMKKPPTGMTKNVLLGTSAALLAFAFLSKKLKKPVGAREGGPKHRPARFGLSTNPWKTRNSPGASTTGKYTTESTS